MPMLLMVLMLTVPAVRAMRDQVRKALDWMQAIPADKDAKLAGLLENEFFRRSPRSHVEKVGEDIENELRTTRTITVGDVIYKTARAIEPLATEIPEAKRRAMRALAPIDAYLARSGGTRLHLTTSEELQIETLAELRRMRLAAESSTWQPSRVLEAYNYAKATGDDIAISYFEDLHGQGWAGRQPSGDEEVQTAVELRRLIDIEQQERVPVDLDDLEAAADEVRILLGRAQSLYKIVPVNAAHRADLADTIEQGLTELADWAPAPEQEPVA